jgi:hypothetical protein
MSTTKLTRTENLAKYVFWLVPGTPTETVRIQIRIKQLYPDPYQSENVDPDKYGLDPQH